MTSSTADIGTDTASATPIPFLDLVQDHRSLEEELVEAFRRAVRSAHFIGGSEVTGFEAEFARYVGTADAVGVASGTDALRLAYIALGLKPGDEIITVPNTFIATTEAITQAGGKIRFVDVSPDTLTIDPGQIEAAISPRTRGIVPVHLYGQVADMDAILEIADRRGLWVIEDACQAHGATYRGKRAGSMGRLAAFSFYPGKNLGALGDAGALTGSDASLMKLVRQYREHGQTEKYYHASEGYTARLDAIQAAFLRVKLRHLDAWTAARRKVAAWYDEALAGIADLERPSDAWGSHVYHLYVTHVPQRDALREHLSRKGIGTGLHYPLPLHLQPAYSSMGLERGTFPVTEHSSERLLSLPMFPELRESHVARVAEAIRSFYGSD